MAAAADIKTFYGDQQIYSRMYQQTLVKTTDFLIEARAKEKNIQKLFDKILTSLGNARNKIAKEQGAIGAEFFGIRRDDLHYNGNFCKTHLALRENYVKYGRKMIAKMASVSSLPHKVTSSCLGRESSFELRELTSSVLSLEKWDKQSTPVELQKIMLSLAALLKAGMSHADLMKIFKEKFPGEYRRDNMIKVISCFKEESPKPASAHDSLLSGAIYLEVEGKPHCLSEYFTWGCPTMIEESRIMIYHQDQFLMDAILRDCSKIFESAVLWKRDSEDLTTLKNRVALLRYELSHAMPFYRGSATIADWIEKAIYASHNLKLSHKNELDVDLEALTSLSLNEFVESYQANTLLE